VLDELDALGMADDTAVLFVSDHGDMLGDHGLSQKNVPYEPSVRIPMILRWPGRTAAGTVCDDLVGLTDVLPTLIEELAVSYPKELSPLPGASLLGRSGGGLAKPREVYAIDYGHDRQRWICLRSQTRKYMLWADGGTEELYDLENDPTELRNTANDDPEETRRLRTQALAWERERGLPRSFEDGAFRVFAPASLPKREPKGVNLNEGMWPDRLPPEQTPEVESFPEAFSRAIAKETALSPEKLSLTDYKRKSGPPLTGTPWEESWRDA
jgi:arylsulfatase A-like enzyme